MANVRRKQPEKEGGLPKTEADIVDKIDPKLFNGANNPEKRLELIRQIQSITKTHSGPLPDSETLQAYKEIYPESIPIIFSVFKDQAKHRMDMESSVITSQQTQSKHGQIYAFLIAILFLIISGICILKGHDIAGGVLGTIDVIGMVTVFITGKQYQVGNLKEKNPKKNELKNAK